MSLYQMQQAIFDHLRRLEDPEDTRRPDDILTDGYDLDDEERTALAAGDVGAFHTQGVHPVLINAYCRANGWKRADYRVLFPPGADAVPAEGRWRGFGSRADGRLDANGRFHLDRPATSAPATSPTDTSTTDTSPGRPADHDLQEA